MLKVVQWYLSAYHVRLAGGIDMFRTPHEIYPLDLAMIESGWAISRYDSRDGYGRHAREDAYVAADVGAPPPADCPSPSTVPTTLLPAPPTGGAGTDPRFGSCAQAKANGTTPYVRGVDPEYEWYRDGDGDGMVCE